MLPHVASSLVVVQEVEGEVLEGGGQAGGFCGWILPEIWTVLTTAYFEAFMLGFVYDLLRRS